jgi:beta-ribofuranosylaminobenzene 5'-phosphate synthase
MLPRGRLANGVYEREFFRQNTPIPEIEAYRTMALMYHGVVPAISMGDLHALSSAINSLQHVGFKKREVAGQGRSVEALLTALQEETGLPVGMSSMGPLLYALLDKSDHQGLSALSKVCERFNAEFLGTCSGWNSPREVVCE